MVEHIPRRTFLDRLRGALLTLLGLSWLAGIASFLFPPRLRRSGRPIVVAKAGKLQNGEVKAVEFYGEPALLQQRQKETVAFSLICSHLGCVVAWKSTEREFRCPCHKGRFDENGQVLSGPPPAPLERLPLKVRGNDILLG